jgi:O-antigen/teichoic acid export membrane protein
MSQIRKRGLKATVWIYVGFLIGAINTYFLTHKDWFTTDQNGLLRSLLEVGMLIYAFSSFGVTSFLYKFFPYYSDNLKKKENDILGLALKVAIAGFLITCAMLWFIEPLIVRKMSTNSKMLVEYFYLTIPLAFCVLIYCVLEAYSYGFDKGVLTNLLRETIVRLYTLAIIVLKICGFINFHVFINLYSLQFLIIIFILAFHLKKHDQLWLTFKPSRVSKKFRRKIIAIMALTFISIIVTVLRSAIDGLVLAAKQNLGKVAIFGFASYMISVIQAPYRSLSAITTPILSRAWKEKNVREIGRIYKRTSINLLSFGLFIFFCIWLNFTNAITYFNINPEYLEGKWVFFLLGIVTLLEVGTGVNGQIIGTSTFWRFELWTSLLLTALIIPLSYYLTVAYGVIGPAIANLASFSVYNAVRIWFLWKKFRMQPFSHKTTEVILIATAGYLVTELIFQNMRGWVPLFGTTILFTAIFAGGIYFRNISPDVKPIIFNMLKRLRRN